MGGSALKSQIGIGTRLPNVKSILDISSNNKGVLLPRVNNINAMNLGVNENGMLMMSADSKKNIFWTGTKWRVFRAIKNAVFTLDCSSIKSSAFLKTNSAASGHIQITVKVTEPGSLNLQTNFQNSVRFIGARTVDAGNEVLTLEAVGTPTTSGNANFTLTSGGTTCTIPITIN